MQSENCIRWNIQDGKKDFFKQDNTIEINSNTELFQINWNHRFEVLTITDDDGDDSNMNQVNQTI